VDADSNSTDRELTETQREQDTSLVRSETVSVAAATTFSTMDWAKHYASQGWRIVPLYEIGSDGKCACGRPEGSKNCTPGKHPRTRNGKDDATDDLTQVTEWWTAWPQRTSGYGWTAAISSSLMWTRETVATRASLDSSKTCNSRRRGE